MTYIKSMNKTNTKTEYQVVRNFFSDAQWDVIDMALNEFQDHDDYVEVLDTIGDKLQTVFDNSVDQSEGNLLCLAYTMNHYLKLCLKKSVQNILNLMRNNASLLLKQGLKITPTN